MKVTVLSLGQVEVMGRRPACPVPGTRWQVQGCQGCTLVGAPATPVLAAGAPGEAVGSASPSRCPQLVVAGGWVGALGGCCSPSRMGWCWF